MNKILDVLRNNLKPTLIVVGSLLAVGLITFLCVAYLEFPIQEGTVTGLYYDEEHISFIEEEDAVYTDEYDYITETYVDEFDHYEYAVYKYFDGEDYKVYISAPSKKIEGKVLTNEFYITAYRYKNLKVGEHFVFYSEEHGDRRREGNNKRTRETSWSMFHHNMNDWKNQEY